MHTTGTVYQVFCQTHSDLCLVLFHQFVSLIFTLSVLLQTALWLLACPGVLCNHRPTPCNTQPCLDRLPDQQHPPLIECLTQSSPLFQPSLFGFGYTVVTTNQRLNNVAHRPVWGLPGQELGLCKHTHCNPPQGRVSMPTNATTRMIEHKIRSSLIYGRTYKLNGRTVYQRTL